MLGLSGASEQIFVDATSDRQFPVEIKRRNSSGDEIANVNFPYDDIVNALQNTIDSCTNSATDRCRYVLEHRITKFSEITQCNGHYVLQGHSTSPILVPIESSNTTSYQWLLLTYLLSCTVSKLWLILFVKFSSARAECLTLTFTLGWFPANIAINDTSLKTGFFGLHFRYRKYWCIK